MVDVKKLLNGNFGCTVQIVIVIFACGVLYQKVSALDTTVGKMEVRLHAVETLLMRGVATN